MNDRQKRTARRCWAGSALALLLLGLALGACGPQGLPLTQEPYRSEAVGVSIRYPEGWFHDESDNIIFVESEEVLIGSVMPTAYVMISGAPLQEAFPGAQNARDVAAVFVQEVSGDEGTVLGEVTDTRVGGEQAAYVDYSTEGLQAPLTGRMVIVCVGERVIIVMGAGTDGGWEEFRSTFDAMLGSMAFFEPSPAP